MPTRPPHRLARIRLAPCLAMLLALLVAAVSADPAAAQMGPGGRRGPAGPTEVGVITAAVTDVPQVVTLPGRAVAYEVATVRPRVGGVIDAITFRAGETLSAGQPMFRLEIGSLDAALAAAEAGEAGARAAQVGAQATVDRYKQLAGKGVSRAELEAAQVALSQAEAGLSQATANLETARLERARASINAPIDGVASRPTVTIGSLVTANQSEALAIVTRLDPIYVDVAASSARILESRRRIADGVMTRIDPPSIALLLEDGLRYDKPGEVVDAGSEVSTTTGTVDLRMQFANPDRLVLPGQFLRVEMTLGTIRAVLVPQRATTRLADGSLSVYRARDGKAERVTLTAVGEYNNAWVVTEGIDQGDAVIVDGLSNLRDGAPVKTVPVTLDDNGVVQDVADAGGAGAGASAAATPAAMRTRGGGAGAPAAMRAADTKTGAEADDWGARLSRWIGLRPGETLAQGAARRWDRLRGLIGVGTAQADS